MTLALIAILLGAAILLVIFGVLLVRADRAEQDLERERRRSARLLDDLRAEQAENRRLREREEDAADWWRRRMNNFNPATGNPFPQGSAPAGETLSSGDCRRAIF